MAISRRDCQQARSNAASALACPAFASSPVSGDTVVVCISSWTSGGLTHQAPTDSQANTYTQIGTTQAGASGDFQMSMWKSENITGGASFVVTGHISISATITCIAVCLTGANTPTSYNGDTVAATATSANPASGTSSPAPAANSYFLACCSKGATNIPTAGSGWQFFTNSTQTDNVTFQDLYVEESTTTSSSAMNGTFTVASENWVARVASFAPAAPLSVDQFGFRARNDDGSETTATWQAAQNTAFTITPDQVFRLRLGVNATGDPVSAGYKLQYRKVGAASWRNVDKFV
jgi:hypothetical protein